MGINAAYVAALQRLTAEKWLRSGPPEEDAPTGTDVDLEDLLEELETEGDADDAVVEAGVDDVDGPSATAGGKPVSWSELLDAYEYGSFGEPGDHSAFLSRKSGEFFYPEMHPDTDEDLPEDINESDDYIRLPEAGVDVDKMFRLVRDDVLILAQ